MAQVTLTLKDLDAPGETYSLNMEVNESRVSDGQYTAAHLVGTVIMNKMAEGSLTREAEKFCRERGIDASQGRQEDASTIEFILTDTDLKGGTYRCDINEKRGPDAVYYTSASAVAAYLAERISTAAFLDEVWEFATKIVAQNPSSSITNADNRPSSAAA